MTTMIEALEWALAEIEGRTKYVCDEQRANALDFAISALEGAKSRQAESGWVVLSGDGKQFRTWKDGSPDWTETLSEAVRYARREDAEAVHSEDEDAWFVKPCASMTPTLPARLTEGEEA